MKTTIEFLDALKARNGGISDYAVAKKIGITHQCISRYRVGKDYFSDSTAIRVSELLQIDPAIVIAAVHAERAKSDQEKAIWREIFEKLGGLAAGVLLTIGAATLPVQQAEASSLSNQANVYYVKSCNPREIAVVIAPIAASRHYPHSVPPKFRTLRLPYSGHPAAKWLLPWTPDLP